jgi:hypothetical protein
MVDLRIQLADTGKTISDQSYFIESLPSSLDRFVNPYEDPTHAVTSYVTSQVRDAAEAARTSKSGKAGAAAEEPMALFGQQSKDKEEKRKTRDLTNVTCYSCGKKGHLKHKCPDKEDEKEKGKGKETGQCEASDENRVQAVRPCQNCPPC